MTFILNVVRNTRIGVGWLSVCRLGQIMCGVWWLSKTDLSSLRPKWERFSFGCVIVCDVRTTIKPTNYVYNLAQSMAKSVNITQIIYAVNSDDFGRQKIVRFVIAGCSARQMEIVNHLILVKSIWISQATENS